ncbi:hypothetical protein J3E68DRAFT_220171 [Trichoderma sp. SZMC 28012]
MYMDLRKWWDDHAEVVLLIGFVGVTAQVKQYRKKGREREKRKETNIRNREMRQHGRCSAYIGRYKVAGLVASLHGRINLPTTSRFGLAPGIGAAFTSIAARIQFGRAGVYEHGECLQCHEPRYEWQGALCKLQLRVQHRPVLVPDGYSVLFSFYKTSSSHQMLFCAVPARPAEAPLETGKAQSRVDQQQRVSTEVESETESVAGDDALAYIRRCTAQLRPTSLHMQEISSTRTSTSSCS